MSGLYRFGIQRGVTGWVLILDSLFAILDREGFCLSRKIKTKELRRQSRFVSLTVVCFSHLPFLHVSFWIVGNARSTPSGTDDLYYWSGTLLK